MHGLHVEVHVDQIIRREKLKGCCSLSELIRQAIDEFLEKREDGKYSGMRRLEIAQALKIELGKRLIECEAEIASLSETG